MKFEIVCDSAADLPRAYAEEQRVTVVPFYVSLDGEIYQKEGEELSIRDFYQSMADRDDCFPRTSMPAIQDYIDAFLPFVEKNMPVLCICLTQKFSGSMQSAMEARLAILEDCPEAEIYVMDSQLVTALQGLFVSEACRLRDLGLSLDRAVELLEPIRSTGRIFFTTKDLKYLEHGGRLNKAVRIAGTMLNLKPILTFCDGELGPVEVSRGRKKSLEKVADNFFAYLDREQIDLKGWLFGTGLGLDVPEYEGFVRNLEQRFQETGKQPDLWIKVHIGATIGVHTGPYPVGLGILKKCDI